MSHINKELLALRHYSYSKPVTCALISGDLCNFFTIKLNESLDLYRSILKGDPVTFGKLDEKKEAYIYGGFVLSKAEKNDITISPDLTSFVMERRKNTRYPVSLFGFLKYGSHKENTSSAWIKDISYEGVRLCTDSSLKVDDNVEVNICIYNKVLNLEGTIVRKSVLYGRNEYGISITFRYKSSVFSTRENIDYLVLQERKLIENHLAAPINLRGFSST